MCSTAAKITAYILLAISGIIGVTSGLGIYSAIVLQFYSMPYYVPDETLILNTQSDYYYENLRIMIFNFKYELIIACILSAIILLACFIFLLCSAGYRKNQEEISAGVLTKIPLDIFFILWLTLGTTIFLFVDLFYDIAAVIYLLVIVLPTCLVLLTSFLADFKLRVKLGKWWQNTLIYSIYTLILKICKKFWNFNKEIFLSLPLI